MTRTKRSLRAFIFICLALSSIFYYLMIVKGMLQLSTLLMWCPGAAAIIVSLIYHRGENAIMFRRAQLKYVLLVLILPLIYWGISYGIYLLIYGKGVIQNNMLRQLLNEPTMLILSVVLYFVTALGEEIGWRGYMMPKLNELCGFNKAVLLCGLAWFLWHLPVFLASYMATIPLWYQIPMLFLLIMAWSFPQGYISLKSKSFWPAAVFHATHNFVAQLLLDQSIGGAMRPYLVGETGIISVAVLLLMAYYFFRRYSIYQSMKLNPLL